MKKNVREMYKPARLIVTHTVQNTHKSICISLTEDTNTHKIKTTDYICGNMFILLLRLATRHLHFNPISLLNKINSMLP